MSIRQKAPPSASASCWQRYRYSSAPSVLLVAMATVGAVGCGGAEPIAPAAGTVDAGPTPAGAHAEPVSDLLSAATAPAASCPAGTDLVGQYATWCGKVNVHTQGSSWVPDSDCSSGCNINTVNYCKRFWPGATVQQVLPAPSSDTKPFQTAGCNRSYPAVGQAQYACCAPPPPPATECFMITGWTTVGVHERANLAVADCTVIPQGTAWTEITQSYSGPVSPRRWVRISLHDPRMAGWRFQDDHYLVWQNSPTTPVLWHDMIPSVPSQPGQQFRPYPPKQGIPQGGTLARLRAVNRGGNCMTGLGQNGAPTVNWTCDDNASLNYVFDNAGSGRFRLRHKLYNQCLWTDDNNIALPLQNQPCSITDVHMQFTPITVPGGYLLRQDYDDLCPLGYWAHGDAVRAWGCSPTDPAMAWAVDIIQY